MDKLEVLLKPITIKEFYEQFKELLSRPYEPPKQGQFFSPSVFCEKHGVAYCGKCFNSKEDK